jgi:hypothetical protein
MANTAPETTPILNSFLLSRAELQAVLALVEIDAFPGLTPDDPVGKLTPEQEAYGIICGERALRARGLAFINEQGEIRISNELLEVIGVCAYASNMLVVTHFPPGGNTARQFAISHLDEHYASHITTPEGALHLLTRYDGKEQVATDICRLFESVKFPEESAIISLSEDALRRIRELVEGGNATQARIMMKEGDVDVSAGEKFISFLERSHDMVVLQAVRRVDVDAISLQTATFLYSQQAIWIATEQDVIDKNQKAEFTVRHTTIPQIKKLIVAMTW